MTNKFEEALNDWCDFQRVDHEDGDITYEAHSNDEDNFIIINGTKSKTVAETILEALRLARDSEKQIQTNKAFFYDGFIAGFKVSGEGYNGEYPFEGSSDDEIWESVREEAIKTWTELEKPTTPPSEEK